MSHSNKTVLLASNLYKPNIGGIENSLCHLAKAYQESGNKALVFASDISPCNKLTSGKQVEESISIYRYEVNKYTGFTRYLRHWINGITLLKRIRRVESPNVVVSRYHYTCVMLKLAGFRKVIYLVPGVVENQNCAEYLRPEKSIPKRIFKRVDHKLNCFLQKYAFNLAHKIGVFSDEMRDQVSSVEPNYLNKTFVCKPGVDIERFYSVSSETKHQLRNQLGLMSDKFVFFCIGRFVKAKGFDYAIKAMQNIENAELWILGAGPDESELQSLVNDLGLKNRVRLLESSSTPELFYRAANAFVLPSIYEPLGQTLLEALASGLPIVAFDSDQQNIHTATKELMSSANAVFAETLNAKALSVAMRKIMNMTESELSEMSVKNSTLAREKYSWLALSQDLEREFNETKKP